MTDNNSDAYLAASPSPSEMEVVEGLLSNGQPLVTLSQAQSALAAMRVERDEATETLRYCERNWSEERGTMIDKFAFERNRAEAAEAQVLRLTEENEALRKERDEADNALVDKYRDPKTGHFKFPADVAAIIRRLDARGARIKALEEALSHALDHYDRNACLHESVHRGGSIWTICDDCGRQWADDKGGFQPHVDPADIAAARTALKENAL